MFDPKTKILIIEDDEDNLACLTTYCNKLGLENITGAMDGKDAWTKINQAAHPFELIISDWKMPNLSGLELLKLCRNDSRHKETPFLMVTALGQTHQITEALRSGATNYLVKPVEKDALREKLETVQSGYKDTQPIKKKPS